jgi:RNA polymerase sigma-70 factor (ECF subfamily)
VRAFEQIDVAQAIRAAVGELSESLRVAFVLVDVEGFSYHDAAAVMEVPIGTVRSRLFRARLALQQQLLAHAVDAGLRAPPASPSLT